jgi:hypothetical protein
LRRRSPRGKKTHIFWKAGPERKKCHQIASCIVCLGWVQCMCAACRNYRSAHIHRQRAYTRIGHIRSGIECPFFYIWAHYPPKLRCKSLRRIDLPLLIPTNNHIGNADAIQYIGFIWWKMSITNWNVELFFLSSYSKANSQFRHWIVGFIYYLR